jgi:peptidoglycan/xylan/chitin deacetylase (PgdA/CDA1 family)
MVQRRNRVLATVLLSLFLAGCTSGDVSRPVASQPSRTPAAASGQGAGGEFSPTPGPSPSRSPSRPPSRSPSPSPTAGSPSTPPPPSSPGATPGFGHGGPFGTINTTGTASVALTFDDGPGGNTGQVLDLLKQYGIHATFCIIGRMIGDYSPDLIRRIVAEGHTLCNHTWSHDLNLRTRSEEQIRSELQRTADAIHAIVPGVPIPYFRNPGGNFSPLTISIAASLGMQSLDWNVDPADWSRPGTQSIINNVLSHTHPGSIVLMHDGGGDRSQTVQALHTILPNLKSRFTLIPLPSAGMGEVSGRPSPAPKEAS